MGTVEEHDVPLADDSTDEDEYEEVGADEEVRERDAVVAAFMRQQHRPSHLAHIAEQRRRIKEAISNGNKNTLDDEQEQTFLNVERALRTHDLMTRLHRWLLTGFMREWTAYLAGGDGRRSIGQSKKTKNSGTSGNEPGVLLYPAFMREFLARRRRRLVFGIDDDSDGYDEGDDSNGDGFEAVVDELLARAA